jgi:phosphoesterase RecJ-like protein
MTPKALRVAAGLMEMGVDLPELYRLALMGQSFEAARLWGAGLSSLEREGSLVWAVLNLADRKAAGYPGRDDADLINILSTIEGADVAVVFTEQPKGRVKVSWRARPGIDVSGLALSFGGGGHPAAAGADSPGKLDEVRPMVLAATQELLSTMERAAHSVQ